MQSVVSQWLGARFERLHSLLQALHLRGGVSIGPVEIALGPGMAPPFGHAIARKLGIPLQPGPHACGSKSVTGPAVCRGTVASTITSAWIPMFRPVGAWPDGLWLKQTGPVRLGLAVEVIDGA